MKLNNIIPMEFKATKYIADTQLVTSKISDIKRVIDKSNLVALPIHAFDLSKSTIRNMFVSDNEHREVNTLISRFLTWCYTKDLQVYALTPIDFFKFDGIVESGLMKLEELKYLAGEKTESFFKAMRMIQPMYNEMSNSLVEARARLLNESRQTQETYIADPILFAFPKNMNINQNMECIIGPVWGPDITTNIVSEMNFKLVNTLQFSINHIAVDLLKSLDNGHTKHIHNYNTERLNHTKNSDSNEETSTFDGKTLIGVTCLIGFIFAMFNICKHLVM